MLKVRIVSNKNNLPELISDKGTILSVDDLCLFHGMPRGLRNKTIMALSEYDAVNAICSIYNENLPNEIDDDKRRKRYFGKKSFAAKTVNTYIKKAVGSLDAEDVRIVRRFPITLRNSIYRSIKNSAYAKQMAEAFPYLIYQSSIKPILLTYIEKSFPINEICKIFKINPIFRKIKPHNIIMHNGLNGLDDNFIHAYLPSKTMEQYRWLKISNQYMYYPHRKWFLKNINTKETLSNIKDNCNLIFDYFNAVGFSEKMSWKTALKNQQDWHRDILLQKECNIKNVQFPKQWIDDFSNDKYSITAIKDSYNLYLEGKELSHCVHSYESIISAGICYIYTVHKSGIKIGTVEIRKNNNGLFSVNQFMGKYNSKPDSKAKEFVNKWIKKANKANNDIV